MSKTRPKFQTESIIKTWPMVRLGEVCNEIKDRIQSSKIAVGEYVTTDSMVKDCGGIVQAGYVPSDVGLVEYHKGDVLIANIRPYLKKIWLADHDGGCSSDVVVFRSNIDGLSSEYLYSVLSQDAYFEYVMQKPRGTKMPRGDRDWMKEFRFPLPSLSVQREIVARLERELAAVEKIKKGFEALAETSKAEFKAELKEAFEEISCGGAETQRLGDVCELIPGFAFKSIEFGDFSTKVIRIGNINPPSIDFSDGIGVNTQAYPQEKLSKYVAYEGDCLVAMTGATIGKMGVMGVGRAYVNQRVLIVRAKSWLDQKYLSALLMSASFRKFTEINADSKAAQPNISAGTIGSYEIPLPPLSAQREVVARLDGAKAKAEKLEAKAREGVAVCETMRKAILKEAFEGSIREVESYG